MSASTYLHSTAASCKTAGCTLTHITLKDLASSCSRAWQGARKGLDMRGPIREYARTGKLKKLGGRSVGVLLQGTKRIRTQAEVAAEITSQRTHWYWHLGDPDIAVVESIIMSTIPCNSEDGPICFCIEPAHDGDDLRQVYSKMQCCSHKFHRACIDGWFKGHQGQCPVCRATHENVTCETCGEEGGVIVCSRCPRVYHVTPQCLGNEDARALLAVQERTRPWDCPTCVQDRDGECSQQQQSSPARSLSGGSSDDEDRSLLDIARGARKGEEAEAVSATMRGKRKAKEPKGQKEQKEQKKPKKPKEKRQRGEDDNIRSALSSSSSTSSTAGPVSSSSSSSKRSSKRSDNNS